MKETNLNISRSKLIEALCGLGPIYVMPFIFQFKEMEWWRFVIAAAVGMVLGGIFSAVFKRFVCPSVADTSAISNTGKFFSYLAVLVITGLGAIMLECFPFGYAINLAISLIINFILTMTLCYYIAKP